MKLLVNRKAFLTELDYVLSAFTSREVVPGEKSRLPLELIARPDDTLSLHTDDGKVMLSTKTSCAARAGQYNSDPIYLYGDKVAEYLHKVQDEQVAIEVESARTSFTHDDGMMAVPHILVRPKMRESSEQPELTLDLPRKEIQRLLDASSFAAIKHWHQYVSGTLLETGNGSLTMVCTDGKILAVADVALEAPAQEMVISPIAMERLKAMVKDCTGDTVTLEHYKSGFVGRCGHRVFASANAGGEFPRKYRSIIPTEGTRLDALVADVIGATKRNMLASTQKDVDLSLTLSQDGLTVESDAGREIVPAFCAAPSPVTVKVSGKYLIGALQACPHERVELLKSAGPLLMTPLAGDLSWKAVIGPVSKS